MRIGGYRCQRYSVDRSDETVEWVGESLILSLEQQVCVSKEKLIVHSKVYNNTGNMNGVTSTNGIVLIVQDETAVAESLIQLEQQVCVASPVGTPLSGCVTVHADALGCPGTLNARQLYCPFFVLTPAGCVQRPLFQKS
jgi:hypothetical protein